MVEFPNHEKVVTEEMATRGGGGGHHDLEEMPGERSENQEMGKV